MIAVDTNILVHAHAMISLHWRGGNDTRRSRVRRCVVGDSMAVRA